jgi:segregation and condensation protein A
VDYEVKLEIFEGPLDLLLHLIYKNEVDIFDIPIAAITDQYLAYLDMMKAFNINVAGDFLVMASTLIHIKSKMLLPGASDEDEEDPRNEIVRPLLEYMQLKEVAQGLNEREMLNRDVFTRSVSRSMKDQVDEQETELDVNLFQLMDAFRRVVDERLPGARFTVQVEQWSVKEKSERILSMLREKGTLFFQEIFERDSKIGEFIVTFLALLELVHVGLVTVFQPSHDSDIRLTPSFDENGVNDGGAAP